MNHARRRLHAFAAAGLLAIAASSVGAGKASGKEAVLECTLIVDAATGVTAHESGRCDERMSPASTFKLPLALAGYDAGILIDEHKPSWDYKPEFNAVKRDHKTVNPTIWERDSVLWYSREITRQMGPERFAGYVSRFGYGNGDISGNPGKNDGLTHSWISSSLKISPREQIAFLRRILARELQVSAKAYDMTNAILPAFEAGGWDVQGKTGSGSVPAASGGKDARQPFGWFVGWADKDGRRLVFARLVVVKERGKSPLGPKTRDAFLKALPTLMAD
ncbi:class D beta-lactamase [Arvimicrobium flavum]|uniref:class D beta-lactamase n=1 Tax=Arvimicrobium flavum TaxID=3393320 RepID=UPI00237BA5A5|nr:class D beta-lactamase [Mesorhizobium shangrilense]